MSISEESGLSSIHSKIKPCHLSPTGAVWVEAHPHRIGQPAGTLNKTNGYFMTSFNGRSYYIHRVLVEQSIGRCLSADEQVDHIDRCRTNNQLDNLRVVDGTVNQHNKGCCVTSRTKVKGLSWSIKDSAWCGHIKHRGKRYTKQSKDRQVVEAWLESTRNTINSI